MKYSFFFEPRVYNFVYMKNQYFQFSLYIDDVCNKMVADVQMKKVFYPVVTEKKFPGYRLKIKNPVR